MGEVIRLRVASSEEAIPLQSAAGSLAVEAVSPRVSFTKVEGGTRLDITDVDGTKSAVLPDGETGPMGPMGPSGADGSIGVGIAYCELLPDYRLQITYTNGVYEVVGPIRGPQGAQGEQGPMGPMGPSGADGSVGVGISYCELLPDYKLQITYTNGLYDIVGPIRGPQGEMGPMGPSGANGSTGVGIVSCDLLQDYRLQITYSNGLYDIVGPIRGAQGEMGPMGPSGANGSTGVGIVSCDLLQDYRLQITYSNGLYDIVGPIRGAQGEPGDDYVLTAQDKADIAGLVDIPVASTSTAGVVKVGAGLAINSSNDLLVDYATASESKAGSNYRKPITPYSQHNAAFYGLAKAAGDSTQASSSNAVGTYTAGAMDKILAMLGVSDMIAPREASAVASKAYAVGDAFIYNGKLYKATAAITSGGAIVPGTNCTTTYLVDLI